MSNEYEIMPYDGGPSTPPDVLPDPVTITMRLTPQDYASPIQRGLVEARVRRELVDALHAHRREPMDSPVGRWTEEHAGQAEHCWRYDLCAALLPIG